MAAILAGVAWVTLRTRNPDPPDGARPAGSVPIIPPRAAVAAPAGPALGSVEPRGSDTAVPRPELPPPAPGVTADVAFAAQPRDADWAPGAEDEIRKRYRQVRGARLEATECRRSQCRLVIAGSEADVGQTIADLERAQGGLRGFAANLVLTAPEHKPDGTMVLRAFAMFDR
jgi:hypothetical protein